LSAFGTAIYDLGSLDGDFLMRIVPPACLSGLLFIAAIAPAAAADPEANKQLVRDYIENVVNKRQPEAAARYFAVDYIEHNPRLPHDGLAGREQFVAGVLQGFSDYHGEVQEILAAGDKVVTRTHWTGTQDGPFLGRPASGKKLDFTTSDFFRFENGKVAEHWDVVDTMAYATSLGLISPPASPR
jgi:steroid delta-isomerase-like uncharacterized protein